MQDGALFCFLSLERVGRTSRVFELKGVLSINNGERSRLSSWPIPSLWCTCTSEGSKDTRVFVSEVAQDNTPPGPIF